MILTCRLATPDDFPAIQQMLELYQYELSDIWPQETDSACRYGYDLTRHRAGSRSHAYVALIGNAYAGVALVAPAAVTRSEGHWMEQFFVLKAHRRHQVGQRLAGFVFASHPGPWEVGQMFANQAAQAFWRKVIPGFGEQGYVELQVTEGWWQGVVQQFNAKAAG